MIIIFFTLVFSDFCVKALVFSNFSFSFLIKKYQMIIKYQIMKKVVLHNPDYLLVTLMM